MASSLFPNDMRPQASGPMGMLEEFNKFKASMQGKDPQAMVQELIRTGRMSQQQFNQLAQMASQLQGIFK